eukprot:scaffold147773_cov34-Prasinocladus_malaysianus.AAC.1
MSLQGGIRRSCSPPLRCDSSILRPNFDRTSSNSVTRCLMVGWRLIRCANTSSAPLCWEPSWRTRAPAGPWAATGTAAGSRGRSWTAPRTAAARKTCFRRSLWPSWRTPDGQPATTTQFHALLWPLPFGLQHDATILF